jgi:hypothetical protein
MSIGEQAITERKLDADERPRKIYTATFKGSGAFPLDMLRYDRCWPRNSDQIPDMALQHFSRRFLETRTVTVSSYQPFTIARWRSFGWDVVPHES